MIRVCFPRALDRLVGKIPYPKDEGQVRELQAGRVCRGQPAWSWQRHFTQQCFATSKAAFYIVFVPFFCAVCHSQCKSASISCMPHRQAFKLFENCRRPAFSTHCFP